MQFFFVNGRFIRNSYLNHSVFTAYEGLVNIENKPSYILFIRIPPDSLDVNVHPNKIEVKFENENSLYAILRSAVRHALGKFNIVPNIDFNNDINLSSGYFSKEISQPLIKIDTKFNPFETDESEIIQKSNDIKYHQEISSSSNVLFNQEDFQNPSIYSSFNFLNKYIVTKTKSELLVIDIKRAYQRILYERILREMNNKTNVSQTLLFPISLSFDSVEYEVLIKLKETLEHLGFIFKKFSNKKIEILGIHPVLNHNDIDGFFKELIENDVLNYKDHSSSINDFLAKLISTSKSLNLTHLVNEKEQILLLNQLFACKESSFTPSMKKIFISIQSNDIKKRFI